MKPIQYYKYLVSAGYTDDLVLLHKGISSRSAEYASMCFQ